MSAGIPTGPTARDWADANLTLDKVEAAGKETIYQLRKEMFINGTRHIQFVWLNQTQLRAVGIDHGL